MNVSLQAPFDLIQATVLLPCPKLGDYIAPQIKVVARTSMDGTLYSTVKTNDRVKLEWEFDLTNAKARELSEFIYYYNTVDWRIYDWYDICYRAKLITNPVVFSPVSKNTVNVKLEFEGRQVG